jgi:hypothetical protein
MTSRLLGLLGTVAVSAAMLTAAPAQAAHDTEPPVLSTPIKAHFVVGSQLDQFRDQEEKHAYYDVPLSFSWSATDNVDTSLNYDVWAHPQGAEPNRIGNFITETTFDVTGSDYDGFFGGAALVIANWSVQAYDDADNSTERSVYGARLLVTQDTGAQTFGSASTDVSLSYGGSWQSASCTCFADKTTHHSNTAGAAAVVKVNVPVAEDVRRVALVMDTAPNRGKAQVKVDGVLDKTIDTGSATVRHKVVVWTAALAPGMHTIRLVNLATANRPRIDLDAVVVN